MPEPSQNTGPPPASLRIEDGFAGQRLLAIPPDRLERARSLPVVRDLLVTHIGHFHAARNHFVERRNGCPQAVLIYCMAGAGFFTLDDTTRPVREGSLFVLPPGVFHRYYADTSDPWSIFWLHFTGERAADHLQALAVSDASPLIEVPNQTVMRDAFEETYRHAIEGFSDPGLLGLTTGLSRLIALARIHSLAGGGRVRKTEDRVLAIIQQLHAEPARDWQIDELASLAGLSLPHFTERFHKQAGCPPKQFLIRLRLQIASALMQDAGLTVAEIANRIGYDDPYYFSRLFRRHTGLSPRAYRRDLGIKTL